MNIPKLFVVVILFLVPKISICQDITLYEQLNGRYDYTAIGNTLNLNENGSGSCVITTQSQSTLNLLPNQTVVAAYLYWAGSGTGDFNIQLNGTPITAQRTFSDALDAERVFFSAFADVTSLIQTQGNGVYVFSELDISSIIAPYCPSGTNFAGWAITVIYEDNTLALNQLNVYDGLQSVPDILSITLDNLNVLDNQDAKIGFIAWEGDASLEVNEQLTINGNVIGNPPLNPINNAFNGTNSFTGESNLYNMDIDFYNIQNTINIGDTSATIQLTSGQDFVMINNIITVLNSQLPDATITLENYVLTCNTSETDIEFTVFNTNSTDILPANTPIAFYADGVLIHQTATLADITINASETQSITINIPSTISTDFELSLVVDDNGTGTGIVVENNETNNTYSETIEMLTSAPLEVLPQIIQCDEGFNSATFNLELLFNSAIATTQPATFYTSLLDLEEDNNPILAPEAFQNSTSPQTIFIKTNGFPCYAIYSFDILVENCPPHIPEGFSPNDDSKNDWFNIQGLYDIFENHKLLIFNRYGTLIFEGNNTTPWDGKANRGLNNKGKLLPVGTYYYILYLNDSSYKNRCGWVYMNY